MHFNVYCKVPDPPEAETLNVIIVPVSIFVLLVVALNESITISSLSLLLSSSENVPDKSPIYDLNVYPSMDFLTIL